jgi:hypothetical protein
MSKKLNIGSITNELTEGSAFFRPHKPQPPKIEAKPPPPPAIRKSVKHPGKEVTFVRLTNEEKEQLGDIVYTYKKQGIKTSENEIARIGLNQLIEDYKTNGQNSTLAQVLKALND